MSIISFSIIQKLKSQDCFDIEEKYILQKQNKNSLKKISYFGLKELSISNERSQFHYVGTYKTSKQVMVSKIIHIAIISKLIFELLCPMKAKDYLEIDIAVQFF